MKRHLLLATLLFATIAQALPYPPIRSYSNTDGGGYPLVRKDGVLDSMVIRRQARWPLITVNVNTARMRPDIIQALRHYNPRITILGYQLLSHWYLLPTFTPQPNDKSFAADWHNAIKGTNGFVAGLPDGYEVDWSKWDTSDSLTTLLVDVGATADLDGIFGDYWATCITWTGSSTPLKDSLRVANFRELVRRLRDIRPGFLVHGNGGKDQSTVGLDGYMREGFPGSLTPVTDALRQREGDWLKAEGPLSNEALARYVSGVACMTGASADYGSNAKPSPAPSHASAYWYGWYSVRPDGTADTTGAHVGWLGAPLGPQYVISGGLVRRDFENGTVIVNTSGTAVLYDMQKQYWREVPAVAGNAPPKQKFNVPSQSAIYLQRVVRPKP